jgi:hypothetical protein
MSTIQADKICLSKGPLNGLDKVLGRIYFYKKDKKQSADPVFLQLQPVQGGLRDFLTSSVNSTVVDIQMLGPSRISMFDDLTYCWILERPPAFDSTSPSLLPLPYCSLKVAAAEWRNFVNVVRYSAEDYESSIESLSFSFADTQKLQTYLRYLQSWRRRCRGSVSKTSSIAKFVDSPSIVSSDPEVWTLMACDYEDIAIDTQIYGRHLEVISPYTTSIV